MDGIVHTPITSQALCDAVSQEIEGYVGFSPQAKMYSLTNHIHQIYAVVIVPHSPSQLASEIVVMARVVDDTIVIEVDTTDKPLVDALVTNKYIPRDQIILAYTGETLSGS
jgi:hypothetical protein